MSCRALACLGRSAIATALTLACAGCGHHAAKRPLSGDAAANLVVFGEPASGPVLAAEHEPDDSVGGAQPLDLEPLASGALSGGVAGALAPVGATGAADVDTYRFEVPTGDGSVLRAELQGAAGVDLSLELLSAAGERLLYLDEGGIGDGEVVPDYGLGPGRYYLRVAEVPHPVKRAKGDTTPPPPPRTTDADYRLTLKLAPPLAGQELEPNDDPDHALGLELGGERHGLLGWRGDKDVYRVALTALPPGAGRSLRADLDGVDGVAAELTVLGDDGARIADARGEPGAAVTLRHVGLPPDARAVWVVAQARSRGNPEMLYGLRVAAEEDEGPTEDEPNDTIAQATELDGEAGTVLGNLPPGDSDFFALQLETAAGASLDLRPPTGETLALDLVDAKGGVLQHAAGDGPGHAVELRAGGQAGTMWLHVTLVHGSAEAAELPYRLSWTLGPAPASLP